MNPFLCIVGALVSAQGGGAPLAPAATWCYAPEYGDRPALRALALEEGCPEGVRETARYRGTARRFAQIRYGAAGSTRVAIALDALADGAFDLYADRNRDRVLADEDRIEGRDRRWVAFVECADADGETAARAPRSVAFALGASGRLLRYGTLGWVEGRVGVEGRVHAARRFDGDGNGFVNDPPDALWIDLDDDGLFDPVTERFLHLPTLVLEGARHVVRSDRLGTQLSLERLEGTGRARLAPVAARAGTGAASAPEAPPKVLALSATLASRDGVAATLDGVGVEAELPAGDYRVSLLTFTLADPIGGEPWSFVFSEDRSRAPRWHKVGKGEPAEIDPLGALEFTVAADGAPRARPGESVGLRVRLHTGDGVLVTTCYQRAGQREWEPGSPRARVLVAAPGRLLGEATSGFA